MSTKTFAPQIIFIVKMNVDLINSSYNSINQRKIFHSINQHHFILQQWINLPVMMFVANLIALNDIKIHKCLFKNIKHHRYRRFSLLILFQSNHIKCTACIHFRRSMKSKYFICIKKQSKQNKKKLKQNIQIGSNHKYNKIKYSTNKKKKRFNIFSWWMLIWCVFLVQPSFLDMFNTNK